MGLKMALEREARLCLKCFRLTAGRTRRSFVTSSQVGSSANQSADEARAQTAFRQRQILEQLRKGGAVSGQTGRNQADELRLAAEAALRGGERGVGPMSLGMMGETGVPSRPSRFDRWSGDGKAWKDLETGQKVARTTIVSSRFIFIAGGAALTLVLAYALATELLARNSPTVVYGEACKLVSTSDAVQLHLLPPYTFQTSLSALTQDGSLPAVRGRRNRNVSAAVLPDQNTGKEIMLLRFFVGARDKDKDLSLWQKTRQATIDGYMWTKERAIDLWSDAQEWWSDEVDTKGYADQTIAASELPASERGLLSGALSGLLGSFIGLTRGAGAAVREMAAHEPGTWSSGEVHGELYKDENGIFQWKHLFVDVPSSASLVRSRVWIIRQPSADRKR